MVHDEYVDEIRKRIPAAVVILAKGSEVSGARSTWSDVDFDVLVNDGDGSWLWWLHAEAGGRLRHVSLAVMSMMSWDAEQAEPQDWALGFAVEAPARLVWAHDEELARRFAKATVRHPSGPPELEDMVESLGKARTGAATADRLGFWPAMHDIGRFAPGVLRPLNPSVTVATRREALLAALSMPMVPDDWYDTLMLCLGLDRGRRDIAMEAALASATSLVRNVIELVSAQPMTILQAAFTTWEVDMLSSGSLIRYVQQGD